MFIYIYIYTHVYIRSDLTYERRESLQNIADLYVNIEMNKTSTAFARCVTSTLKCLSSMVQSLRLFVSARNR